MFVFNSPAVRIPRAWRDHVSPLIAFQVPDPPAPPSGGGAPPPDPIAITPPPPPRGANQSDQDRLTQLEEATANLRVEAAGRRISERDAKERAAVLEREIAQIRQDATNREAAARAEGDTKVGKIKTRTIDAELRAQATAAGLRDLDLLPLIDRTALTCDDDGNVAGVGEAIAAFKTKKPEFFQAPVGGAPAPLPPARSGHPAPTPPGPGAQPPAPTSVTSIPRGTPEGRAEYAKKKEAAIASLRGR